MNYTMIFSISLLLTNCYSYQMIFAGERATQPGKSAPESLNNHGIIKGENTIIEGKGIIIKHCDTHIQSGTIIGHQDSISFSNNINVNDRAQQQNIQAYFHDSRTVEAMARENNLNLSPRAFVRELQTQSPFFNKRWFLYAAGAVVIFAIDVAYGRYKSNQNEMPT